MLYTLEGVRAKYSTKSCDVNEDILAQNLCGKIITPLFIRVHTVFPAWIVFWKLCIMLGSIASRWCYGQAFEKVRVIWPKICPDKVFPKTFHYGKELKQIVRDRQAISKMKSISSSLLNQIKKIS